VWISYGGSMRSFRSLRSGALWNLLSQDTGQTTSGKTRIHGNISWETPGKIIDRVWFTHGLHVRVVLSKLIRHFCEVLCVTGDPITSLYSCVCVDWLTSLTFTQIRGIFTVIVLPDCFTRFVGFWVRSWRFSPGKWHHLKVGVYLFTFYTQIHTFFSI